MEWPACDLGFETVHLAQLKSEKIEMMYVEI